MTTSFANDVEHYESYAQHCLKLASQVPDRDSRLILREMAAEWLKLALPAVFDGEGKDHAPPTNGAHFND